MIIVVGGIKGGSGKTMLATNLAVESVTMGKRVLLVDGDEQKSASDWMAQRYSAGLKHNLTWVQSGGKLMGSTLRDMQPNYDDIIVDVGGRNTTSLRSSMTVADVFIAPFRPRSADLWTLDELTELIGLIKSHHQKLICYGVINQADSVGKDNQEAVTMINECDNIKCIPTTIGLRKSFSNAFGMGLGVRELVSTDGDSLKKSQREIKEFYEYVFRI